MVKVNYKSDRKISYLVAQCLTSTLRKQKVPDSNPNVGKIIHFVILDSRSSQLE